MQFLATVDILFVDIGGASCVCLSGPQSAFFLRHHQAAKIGTLWAFPCIFEEQTDGATGTPSPGTSRGASWWLFCENYNDQMFK
jgi:hypothetical protein